MGNQPALRVDHIGTAAGADLDLRDDVPDEFEIDLGGADTGVATRAGDGERHIGLGLAPEIDRPVEGAACHRLGEARLLREVQLAVDHVHGQARDFQALLPGGVDLGQLGDCRYLAQQAQRVEAALVESAGRPRQLSSPAELTLDLLGTR